MTPEQITVPRETWDAMLKALDECASIIDHCVIGCDAENAVSKARTALNAANSVSEQPKVIQVMGLNVVLDPTMKPNEMKLVQPQARGQAIYQYAITPTGTWFDISKDAYDFWLKREVSKTRIVYAHPEATEPGGWRPIESAPKSEEVLLWATKQKPHAFIGFWDEYDTYNQPRITHWMPLPEAPEATNG